MASTYVKMSSSEFSLPNHSTRQVFLSFKKSLSWHFVDRLKSGFWAIFGKFSHTYVEKSGYTVELIFYLGLWIFYMNLKLFTLKGRGVFCFRFLNFFYYSKINFHENLINFFSIYFFQDVSTEGSPKKDKKKRKGLRTPSFLKKRKDKKKVEA